jgi:NADPH2:quinone reductase
MTIPKTMRAAAIDGFGGPENLKLRELPVPTVGADEVLIKVEVAGVGVWDAAERAGLMADLFPANAKIFPRVLGGDGAGTVAAVGTNIAGFDVGDKVYGFGFFNPKGGFYAEYVALSANQVARLPKNLDMQQAGALAVTGVTALRGLADSLNVQASQRLLIFGASGGVGLPAVQLAKAMNAKVLAVVTGAEGAALARNAGADKVVNSKEENLADAIAAFAPGGLDCVLAVVNGAGLDTAIAAIRTGGRVAYPRGVRPEPKGRPGVESVGFDGVPDRQVLDKLNMLIESRPFSVHIFESFALADASEAHRALSGHHLGRMVLKID